MTILGGVCLSLLLGGWLASQVFGIAASLRTLLRLNAEIKVLEERKRLREERERLRGNLGEGSQ